MTHPLRPDLLALTPDALAALTNRGLVKRATKTVDEGTGPDVSVDDDGDTVRGVFPDGVVTTLPSGGLTAGSCDCDAPGVCRHILALVLAYQRDQSSSDTPAASIAAEAWSPGEFTDSELELHFGTRLMATARRHLADGYLARVRPATSDDPVPHVELPACNVRFLVAHDLGYTRSDARDDAGAESVVLAVWAWRRAEELGVVASGAHFAVGGKEAAAEPSATAAPITLATDDSANAPSAPSAPTDTSASAAEIALHAATDLASEILLTGVAHLGDGFDQRVAAVSRALNAAGLRWPLLAVAELADQLDAYTTRAARYQPERVAELLAELAARHRASAFAGGEPRARVLGTEEAAEVQLRRVRLAGLGCRVHALGEERRVQIFLADFGSGTVFTLNHSWPQEPDTTTGDVLRSRRLAASTVGALSSGNIVTESAIRSADRRLRLGVNRIAKTTVSQSSGNWESLPAPLLVRDLDALARDLDGLPPRLIRPRIDAEDVRVIEIGEVSRLSYHPGSQRLTASITGAAGGTATLVAGHGFATPGALDALATALAAEPRHLSATVRRGRGGLTLSPIAVVAGQQVIVPDLAPGDGGTTLAVGDRTGLDPLSQALESALSLTAELAHRGARRLPTSFPTRLEAAARALAAAGLGRSADELRALMSSLSTDPGPATALAWTNVQIRLLATAEAR